MKLSIVIPTRNRARYLSHALRTCMAVDDASLEIIVSDNNSNDDTRAVVAACNDPRIVYVHTGASVSMRQNYEHALSKVTGDYALFIGDDDGVLKSGVEMLLDVLDRERPDAVNWQTISYIWPRRLSAQPVDGILRLRAKHFFGGLRRIDAAGVWRRFCAGTVTKYRCGANLYHGCVSMKVIRGLQEQTGAYFQGRAPDVYAALANLSRARKFLFIGHPVTIAGEGEHSSGGAMHVRGQQTENQKKLAADFIALAGEDPVNAESDFRMRSVVGHTYALVCRVNALLYGGKTPVNHARWRRQVVRDTARFPANVRHENGPIIHALFRKLDPAYVAADIPFAADAGAVVDAAPAGGARKTFRPESLLTIETAVHLVESVAAAHYRPRRGILGFVVHCLRKPGVYDRLRKERRRA